ncbi:MAG: methyltransferase family protein [Sphingopyxis sp.]
MLKFLPLTLFLLVLAATLIRGRAVRAQSGISAWAFADARGVQRLAGLAFALSIAVLVAGVALLAAGRIAAPTPPLAAGSTVMAIGTLVVIAAQRQMGAAWRVGVRAGDAPLFVTAGLFRFSRNPIFVGMIAMAVGAALALSTPWGWLAAVAFALACHIQVRIEEAHLARQFGPAYDDFREKVPRWLLL